MSNENAIHELYEQCMTINFDETHILLEKAKTKEEKEFVRLVTDFVLQQRQKKAITEKRF